MKSNHFNHQSVLVEESLAALSLKKGDCVVDCTAGGGGHSSQIIKSIAPGGQLICLDRDSQAIQHLTEQFKQEIEARDITVIKSPFSKIKNIAKMMGLEGKISAIFADIGVSSPQLDLAERGFSFSKDGPLDMRMDREANETAADVVNSREEKELKQIFQEYGEERFAQRIARRIVQAREKENIQTTAQLSTIISSCIPKGKQNKHPATRVFQALRIYVNDELGELKRFLSDSFEILKPNGRLAVISFHSLEDRIIKEFFKGKERKTFANPMLKYLPIAESEEEKEGEIIKPFPVIPSEEEIRSNPRSRSAKLRVIEKY